MLLILLDSNRSGIKPGAVHIEVTDDYDLALKPIDVNYAEELLPTC